MKLWRHSVTLGMIIFGCVWLANYFTIIALPETFSRYFGITFYVLLWLNLLLSWLNRKNPSHNPQHKDPSPARSAVGVIVGTGLIAVLITAQNVDSPAGYILPASILIVTVFAAAAAFRFASKNQNQIGEARFDTTSNGSSPPVS